MNYLFRVSIPCLLAIFFINPCTAKLQGKARIDSLLARLPKAKEDTAKVNILCNLSVTYQLVNPDEGIKMAQQGLALATKLGWKKGSALAHNALGLNNNIKAMYSEAEQHLSAALKINEELNDKRGIAVSTGNLGLVYTSKGDYGKALDAYTSALKMHEETGDKQQIIKVTINLGNVYMYQGNFAKALGYYLKSLEMAEKSGDKQSIEILCSNIGGIYYYQKDFTRSAEYYFKALKMAEELGDKYTTATVTGNIGGVYFDQGDFSKALEYFNKALKMYEESGDKKAISTFNANIGEVYAGKNELDKALEYFFSALKIDEETGYKNGIARVKGAIGNVYAKQSDYHMAIGYCSEALKLSEAIGDKQNTATVLFYMGNAYLSLVADTGKKSRKSTAELPEREYAPEGSIPSDKAARLHNAISSLQRALDMAKILETPDLVQNCNEALASAYKMTGDYKRAMDHYQQFIAHRDSTSSKENEKKILRAGIQYEYNTQHLADSLKNVKKEEIHKLKLQRQQSYTYIGIAAVLLLAGFSFFMLRNNKLLIKEKERSEDLLLNILPAEVAAELKNTGTAVAKQYENVTVLFTDFVNFTQAGEKMSPTALINELHTCFKNFDEIAAKYGIEKIKTIGDAYLAVAGLPNADAHHAENAIKAAVDIRNFVNDRYAKLGDRTFEVRIGVHSGSLVAGIVGVKKFAYDVWGDTVNTAARMEQNSEPGKINISETTFELIKDKFHCVYRGEIDAKNKGELKMYFVA